MASGSLLPVHQRFVNGVQMPTTRRTLRLKEKYLIVLLFVTFVVFCFGTFFLLPDLREVVSVNDMRKQFRVAGQEMFLPKADADDLTDTFGALNLPDTAKRKRGIVMKHDNGQDFDLHVIEDRAKILQKIEEAREQEKVLARIRNKLNITHMGKITHISSDPASRKAVQSVIASLSGVSNSDKITAQATFSTELKIDFAAGTPKDPQVKEKRDFVRNMMRHAWAGYQRYAWGANELKPISRSGHTGSVFGNTPFGASIVDGLDTLYLMELHDEYQKGRDWVEKSLSFRGKIDILISVFEVNIRFIGGMLSCYAMTKDEMFKNKAIEIADQLLPAFNTPTGVPYARVNLKTGTGRNWSWASGGCSILAEYGTLHLEFAYLSHITGNPIYLQKVLHIRDVLRKLERPHGLFPNYLNPKTGKWGQLHYSVGALGDSFYEYLLKAWIQSGKTDYEARDMYESAVKDIEKKLVHTSRGGLRYIAESRNGRVEHKMDHLSCFAGGMFALGAGGSNDEDHYMQLAKDITHTCHHAYSKSHTKLGPEAFRFEIGDEARAVRTNEKYYILRPEVIESYYYLWLSTRDEKYRQWGWEAAQAIERWCRVETGYTGIRDVYLTSPPKDDVMQSYFLAETLKYLYLLFSEPELLPLDRWVINTEAHPLPILQPSVS